MVIKITFRYLILYILLTHSFPQLEGRSKGKGSTDIRLGLRYHIKIGEHSFILKLNFLSVLCGVFLSGTFTSLYCLNIYYLLS